MDGFRLRGGSRGEGGGLLESAEGTVGFAFSPEVSLAERITSGDTVDVEAEDVVLVVVVVLSEDVEEMVLVDEMEVVLVVLVV